MQRKIHDLFEYPPPPYKCGTEGWREIGTVFTVGRNLGMKHIFGVGSALELKLSDFGTTYICPGVNEIIDPVFGSLIPYVCLY